MDICNWCFKPVTEPGPVSGWHEGCIKMVAEAMELMAETAKLMGLSEDD